jgi:hypothetical protein
VKVQGWPSTAAVGYQDIYNKKDLHWLIMNQKMAAGHVPE